MARRSIYLIALAVIAPYLYDRYLALSDLLGNRPGVYTNFNAFKSHEIKFRDRLRNCEDVLLEEGMGIAFVSCNPGRDRWNTVMGTFMPPVNQRSEDDAHIWIYDYSTPDLSASMALRPLELADYANQEDFHPLGIEFDAATSTLYVINHSRNSGNVIEVFQVSVQDAIGKHMQTLKQHPLIYTPNSIHSLGDCKLLVTNDHFISATTSPFLSTLEAYAAIPGGSIVYTDIHNPSSTKLLARVPFANGIAMLNSTTVAVASTTKAGIYLYTFNPEQPSLKFKKYIRTPAAADNLSADSSGKILIAGHAFAPGLSKVSKARGKCDFQGSEEEMKACECMAPSWAAEWSEEGGLRVLYRNTGEEFCSSSTFARDVGRGVGIVSGLYEKGLLVANE